MIFKQYIQELEEIIKQLKERKKILLKIGYSEKIVDEYLKTTTIIYNVKN